MNTVYVAAKVNQQPKAEVTKPVLKKKRKSKSVKKILNTTPVSLVPIEELENAGCVREMFFEHTRQLDSIFNSEKESDTDTTKDDVPIQTPEIEVSELDKKIEVNFD